MGKLIDKTLQAEIQRNCPHQGDEDYWIDNSLYCGDCHACIGVTCPLCGGDGFMPEDEMECDWINCGSDLVTCRECRGVGWVENPSFQ